MSILRSIPQEKQDKRGWKLEVNGEPVENVSSLRLYNDRFVTLEYGETPAGYDGLTLDERGGGGSVIVPWFVQEGFDDLNYPAASKPKQLYIGLVEQDRFTMGGKVWNLPRGFLDKGETHFEAARREAGEEVRFNLTERFVELPGEHTNWNSAYCLTIGPNKGVRYYGLRIVIGELQQTFDEAFTFRPEVLKPVSKVGEQIFRCKFVPYTEALLRADQFTVTGVGRLLTTFSLQIM